MTKLGWGKHGLIGLIMKTDNYEPKTGIPFLLTMVKPLTYDTTIPNVASIQVRIQHKDEHKDSIKTYAVCCAA